MKSPQKPNSVNQTPLTLFWKASLLLGLALFNPNTSSFVQAKPGNGHISDDEWAHLKGTTHQHKHFGKDYPVNDSLVLDDVSYIAPGVEVTVNGTLFLDGGSINNSGHLHVKNGGHLILSDSTLVDRQNGLTTIDVGGVLTIADITPATLHSTPTAGHVSGKIVCNGEINGGGTINSNVDLGVGGLIVLDAMPKTDFVPFNYVPSSSLITITGSLGAPSGSVTENIQVVVTGGTTNVTYGQLSVYGPVSINGPTLTVKTTTNQSGVYPQVNYKMDMIVADSVTGDFKKPFTFNPNTAGWPTYTGAISPWVPDPQNAKAYYIWRQ